MVRKDKDALLKLTTDIQTTSNTSVGALNYVIQNHKKAPPLQKLDHKKAKRLLKFKENDEPFVDDELVEYLIYNFKKKNLDKCIGDMLLKHYKKTNPSEQSIWNSDTSRLTFLIKDIVGDKSEWMTDKKGVKLINYVIRPVSELIISLLRDYIQNQNQNDNKNYKKKLEYMTLASEMEVILKLKKIDIDIARHMGPHFNINRIDDFKKNTCNSSSQNE